MRTLLQLTMLCAFVMHQVVSEENDEENGCGLDPLHIMRDGIIVTSPNFPHPYPHNLNCTYFIHVGRNNSVILKFLAFDLELPLDDGNCTHDWLTVTCNETDDENVDFETRLCGTDLPWSSLRFSNCPVVNLTFFADSSVNGGGFSIEFTVFDDVNFSDVNLDLECGTTVFTSSSGSISLPKNSAEYPARVNCTYTISANRASRIWLGIKSLQMPQLMNSFSDCNNEKIMVGCVSGGERELNPNTSNTYCRPHFSRSLSPPNEINFPNCTMVKISMQSSHYNYRAAYDIIPFTVHALGVDCGTTAFTGPRGIIKSPSFPQSYPNRLDCVYTIDVDRTKNITLDFISFHLEGTSNYPMVDNCDYDWLKIRCLSYDFVRTEPSQDLYKHCGEMTRSITIDFSTCDYLTLNFVSDSSDSYGGFQILYIITSSAKDTTSTPDVQDDRCGNSSFSGSVGFISSPLFPQSYPEDMQCAYSIDVDKTKVTSLHFFSFNLEGKSQTTYLDSCIYDWLLIRCLLNVSVATQNHRSRKYCGERATPLMLSYSNCDSLTLYFVSDHSESRGGFRLQYTISLADEEDCGITLFSGPNGVVTSPNYPFPYPHNISCKYSIDVGRNNSVLLKFKHFDLEAPTSTDFSKDWLMISCNETAKPNPHYHKKYRGSIRWTSSMRFIDCPSLVLEFHSDSTVNGEGFMIEYGVIEYSNSTDDNFELDCGATPYTDSYPFIYIPINTKNYLGTVNCTYTILTKQISYFWLKTDMYFEPSANILQSFQDCDSESLTIGCVPEGETEPNPNTTLVFCRDRTPADYKPDEQLVFADCRQLKMSIRSTNYDNRERIRIPVSSEGHEELCGTTSFSDSSGTISSSRIHWHSPKRFHCVYIINSGHLNSVVIQLRRLHFHIQNASCSSGWLTISCIFNGTSVPHPLADRKLCKIPDLPAIRFPACRSVVLNYDADFMSYQTGFLIRYRMGDYDPECGNISFIGPNGFISSPQFQLLQKHHLNCLYSITGGQRTTISLAFLTFNIEGKSNTPFIDSCEDDWLTVSCLSDHSIEANISSSRRYCGIKTTPLKFTFRSCDVVVLNFQGNSIVFGGRFDVRYTVVDTESLCGLPVYGPPSGVFSFPLNTKDYVDSFDCTYVINATERSSISLSIWSISHQSSVERNCQRDWLLFTCISGQSQLDHRVNHRSCDHHNSITQITFPSCATTQVDFHKESEDNGKTFRIEYTISAHGESFVDTQMSSSAQTGQLVGISLAVILVVTGSLCLGAFLILRLHRKKVRSQRLLHQANEEESHITLEPNDDSSAAGHRNDEQDTSRYLPLKPMTISDHEES